MSMVRFQLEKGGKVSDLDIVYDDLYAIGYAGPEYGKNVRTYPGTERTFWCSCSQTDSYDFPNVQYVADSRFGYSFCQP